MKSQGQYMLVDCGENCDPSVHAIGRALKGIEVPAGGLACLVLTPGHADHRGAARLIQQERNGRVLMNPVDAEVEIYPHWATTTGRLPEALGGDVGLILFASSPILYLLDDFVGKKEDK